MASALICGDVSRVDGPVAEIGESPVWSPEDSRLLWVDLFNGRIHRTDPKASTTDTIDVDGQCGFVALARGGIVHASGSRILVRNQSGVVEIADLDPVGGLRINDSQVAPGGWLFSGLMHTVSAKRFESGRLVRVSADGDVGLVADRVTISNGMGWSPDTTRMYYVDMPLKRVDIFDYDSSAGEAVNRRPAFELDVPGVPDGMAVDAEGRLWIAMWGTPFVRCFDPNGQERARVEVPVANVTSCAFGGDDLSTLFITTSSRDAAADHSHAGGVFCVQTDTQGQAPRVFG